MPNPTNIDAPVILVGAGRSGTSLVSRLFDLHPDCSTVGETANLIFGPWNALAQSSASIAPHVENGGWVAEDERAGRVVRQTFLSCFPDEKRYWMQKPIGIPKALSERFDNVKSQEAGAWYWRVMRSAFPRARFMAILRHPCDVVLSGRSKWGFADGSMWWTMATLAGYLTHADSPVRHVIRYEQLVAEPEATVRAICEAADVPFAATMLGAFDEIHVPAPGRTDPAQSGYTRRTDWATLDPAELSPAHRQAITDVYERFGGGLEWPPHFTASQSNVVSETQRPALTEVQSLQAQVRQLSARVEQLMFDHAEELKRRDETWQRREHAFFDAMQSREQEFASRERELTGLWADQKAWIEELERVKAWLEGQVANWRSVAEGRKG